jgi:hypothetical protein
MPEFQAGVYRNTLSAAEFEGFTELALVTEIPYCAA